MYPYNTGTQPDEPTPVWAEQPYTNGLFWNCPFQQPSGGGRSFPFQSGDFGLSGAYNMTALFVGFSRIVPPPDRSNTGRFLPLRRCVFFRDRNLPVLTYVFLLKSSVFHTVLPPYPTLPAPSPATIGNPLLAPHIPQCGHPLRIHCSNNGSIPWGRHRASHTALRYPIPC